MARLDHLLFALLLLFSLDLSCAQLQAPWPMQFHDSGFMSAAPPATLPADNYCQKQVSVGWKYPAAIGDLLLPSPGIVLLTSGVTSKGVSIELFNRSTGHVTTMLVPDVYQSIGFDSTGARRFYFMKPSNGTTQAICAYSLLTQSVLWEVAIDESQTAYYNSFADSIEVFGPPGVGQQLTRYVGKSGTLKWTVNVPQSPQGYNRPYWIGATTTGHALIAATNTAVQPVSIWISALDSTSGNQKWSTVLPGVWPSNIAVFTATSNGIAVWASLQATAENRTRGQNVVYGLNSITGHMTWNVSLLPCLGSAILASSPQLNAVVAACVCTKCGNNPLFVLNATSGTLAAYFNTTSSFRSLWSIGMHIFWATSEPAGVYRLVSSNQNGIEQVSSSGVDRQVVDSDGTILYFQTTDVHGQPTDERKLWSLMPSTLAACKKHKKDATGRTVSIVLLTIGCTMLSAVVLAGLYYWYRKYRQPREEYQPVY